MLIASAFVQGCIAFEAPRAPVVMPVPGHEAQQASDMAYCLNWAATAFTMGSAVSKCMREKGYIVLHD